MSQPKKILVAPLDWGLGHASRCIPIILELQRQGAEVLLASGGRALVLLRQEFPELTSFELPAYDVQYRSSNMIWNIATQMPKILWAIWQEHWAVKRLATIHGVTGIISDNRFGCYISKNRCAFITHQVNIPVPFAFFKKVVNFFNNLIISQFDECWIPDVQGQPNLSGELSHPIHWRLKKMTKYIGALSRMQLGTPKNERYAAIAVLSGPEPQRTYFENAIVTQAGQINGRLLIVQGKPTTQPTNNSVIRQKNIDIIASMTSTTLNNAILNSGIFIGRSGYSTIMDLAKLGKPALLVPTPGQTEQEYLAEKFVKENIFFAQTQDALNLSEGIREAKTRTGIQSSFFDETALKNTIATFLNYC